MIFTQQYPREEAITMWNACHKETILVKELGISIRREVNDPSFNLPRMIDPVMTLHFLSESLQIPDMCKTTVMKETQTTSLDSWLIRRANSLPLRIFRQPTTVYILSFI